MSDSGPTSIMDNARLAANKLTDRATSGGEIWKQADRSGKEGRTTSNGNTPSSVMVISNRMISDFSLAFVAGGIIQRSRTVRGGTRIELRRAQVNAVGVGPF
ncbi:hypothetical protein D3C87_1699390 [compost metagenome]